MEWLKVTLRLPFIALNVISSYLTYHFDRTIRPQRFAALQVYQLMLCLSKALMPVKAELNDVKAELEQIEESTLSAQNNLRQALDSLKNTYGFDNIESAINRNHSTHSEDSLELDELVARILSLYDFLSKETEVEASITSLQQRLQTLQKANEDLDYALINIASYMDRGDIKRSRDISDMFKVTTSEHILIQTEISIEKCGVDAYFR